MRVFTIGKIRKLACALAAVLLLASCGPPRADRIVIGSKNFTEQLVLGEIIAQQIENKTHLPVERRFYLAGTYICHQSILGGRIDVYPEYTGTALTAILKAQPTSNPQQVYDQVKTEYARRFNLDVGQTFGFNDTFAIEIRGEDARHLGLKTISQAAAYTPQWRAGFGYEFMERPDGYAGLVSTYGLKFAAAPRLMDLGLLYRALEEKQVDIVAGSATDGIISARGFVVLQDDKRYFPPYEAVPIVNRKAFERQPALEGALKAIAGQITAEEMRRLNYAVDGEHQDVKEVVRTFLAAKEIR